MTKRVWPWIALGVVVVVVLAVALWPNERPDARPSARTPSPPGCKCPECQGLSVADSNAPTSKAIRADIARRIADGESDGEIRQYYVDQYGESILLDPQSSGIGLLVWVLPVVVLVGRRDRDRVRARAQPPRAAPARDRRRRGARRA